MKIICYADNHFSEKSSIVTKYGINYTLRLENQIKSINWVEQMAVKQNCDLIICLGDFFDHPRLTDQELTALNEIQWSNISHYFLVGNHESEENNLQYSSTMALAGPNRVILNEPTLLQMNTTGTDIELAFLPYIVESNRRAITEYFDPVGDKLRILFSHNDLLGIQMGPAVSKLGFSIEDLEKNCSLCVNGHLHNGRQVSRKVVNLGNLTGKDFGEDANVYTHQIMLIDTDKMECQFIENPFAFNFYKIEVNTEADFAKLTNLKSNAVVSVKCKDSYLKQTRMQLEANPNIIESRVIVVRDVDSTKDDNIDISSLVVDQYAKFAECCRAKLDNSDILEAELAAILK